MKKQTKKPVKTPRHFHLFIHGYSWSAAFQERPCLQLTVTGTRPTKKQFRAIFASTMLPIFAVDALYVAVADKFRAMD